jgi:aminopeptidase-like protein
MSYQFREGRFMWDQAEELFPICRSITGEGLRHTLSHLQNIIPEIEIKEVPSGQQIFDWTIPNEWNVRDAFILTPNGEKIANFRENNLHLVSYSEPIQKKLSLDELQPHLHSIPDKPDLVPYRTSYYRRDWGFCMPHNLRQKLQQGTYEVFIDTKLEPGFLNYAELYISGQSKEEIMFSTYCCHPSLANDNLSGVVLALALAMGLQEREKLRHSYRFLWTPETIGALAWLHDNLDHAKESVKAGFVLTCVGDEGPFSYMPSRTGKTLADRLICAVLLANELPYCAYSFHQRGSDERQFCHPNIDLPFASLMRSKYDEFDEYHTSADNMDFLSKNALQETYDLHMQMIELLEENRVYTPTTVGEPQLGKRNLYSSLSKSVLDGDETIRYKILGYADGKLDLLSLTEIVKAPPPVIIEQIQKLVDAKVLELVT